MESGAQMAGRANPGTWRDSDGARVHFADARRIWADEAREVLLEVAGRYHAYITYAELGRAVQDRAGVRTRSLLTNWIGDVLGQVAQDCGRRGEPILTALCARQDETVGVGYAEAVRGVYGFTPDDPDQHAAEERLACYRAFGAEMPPDGGRPALTARVGRARAEAVRARQVERPAASCPTCFMQLPASGRCDTCA